MKKIIKTAALCALIALTAFSLAACGMSGAAVDKDTFNNAENNFKTAFATKAVTVEYTYRVTEDTTIETVSSSGFGNANKKTIARNNGRAELTHTAIYDGQSAYIKSNDMNETIISSGSNTKSKNETETYYTVSDNFVYTVEKGMDGAWQVMEKVRLSAGNTFADYIANRFLQYAFIMYTAEIDFDKYDYSGGRYNQKQRIIEESQSEDTQNTEYNYSNAYLYMVFNADGLFAGCEKNYNCNEIESNDSSSLYGNQSTVTRKISFTESSKVTYSGKVTLPEYTNDLD